MSGRKRRFEKFGRSSEGKDSSSDDEARPAGLQQSTEIGPSLPPHLKQNQSAGPSRQQSKEEKVAIGPVLPKHLRRNHTDDSKAEEKTIGPIMPPNLRKSVSDSSNESRIEIGPVLPPHLKTNQTVVNEQKTTNAIGPIMPPHLRKSLSDSPKDESVEKFNESNTGIGPVLPAHLRKNEMVENEQNTAKVIGPIMPQHLLKSKSSDELNEDPSIGPILPPHLANKELDVAGPALPPHLQAKQPDTLQKPERILGPSLPPGFALPADSDSDSEEDTFGPDPRLKHSGDVSMESVVEARAERARRKMLGLDDKKVERETWMLELPPEKAAIVGMGPRQFRAKLAPEMGDRSVWTDTPSEAAKKAGEPAKQDDAAIMQQAIIDRRDREMEKMARKAAKKAKRDQSLVDLHAKKMQKQAKEDAKKMEGKPKERKMFSREEDMQVHRFDEAQKKAILKKAQMLDDRFSRGQSKFL